MVTRTSIPRPRPGLLFAAAGLACATALAGAPAAWEIVPTPNAGALTNQLFAVGASSPDHAWAVGVSKDSLLDKPDPLAMRWDGAGWAIVPTPNPNAALQTNTLRGVAVVGPADAWAVGGSTFGPNTMPFVLRWDGEAWTQQDVGDFPAPSSLWGTHAIAPDDVWAVGVTLGGTGFVTLAMHYDGSTWTATDIPGTGLGNEHALQDVHGLAADDVWATGWVNNGGGGFWPLAAHWDGSDWSSLVLPQGDGLGCEAHSVVMIAPDDVWAVGQCDSLSDGSQPYAVHFDGSGWLVAAMPLIPDGHARLEEVVARAPDDVWAAGTNADAEGIPRPLVMHYDGAAWQEVAVGASGGSHEWFFGMVAPPGGGAWAVGQYYDGTRTATLAAALTGEAPEPCPADADGDGDVDVDDLNAVVLDWGGNGSAHGGDIAGSLPGSPPDGLVDVNDLAAVITGWGACP